jgi:hypothetical protein
VIARGRSALCPEIGGRCARLSVERPSARFAELAAAPISCRDMPRFSVSAAFCVLALLAPAAASAKPRVVSASGCAERAFSTVFSAYHDTALYTLAPGGDFEAGTDGWTLSDGASLAGESSSIVLGAGLGASSLELAAGASAVTPPICVERGFPAFRFAARSAGERRGVVRVQVLYGAGGKSKKTGRIRARASWKLTRRLSLAQGRFHVKPGGSADVRLRFTVSRAAVLLDDVYVDPRLRR